MVVPLLLVASVLQAQAAAQEPPIDTALAARYFQEAQNLCRKDSGRLWGVSLCGPMVLVDQKTRIAVANQLDEEGALTKQGTVFVGKLPATVTVANTATKWAGVEWTMILLPLPDDKYQRDRLMAHEMWHRIQNNIGFPMSGAANNHLDTREGRIWLQLEWRALTASLSSHGQHRRQAVEDALLFREYRRELFPQAASEEREMEMHEGLAEYTGVKLSGDPNLAQFVIDADLKDAAQKPSFVRSFPYASGPAYGILLDETGKEWRKHLTKKDDLGALLRNALDIVPPRNIKQAAEVRSKSYNGNQLQTLEAKREETQQKLCAEYQKILVGGPILSLPLQKMSLQFDPRNLLPLNPFGTVYPTIRVVAAWGVLTVSEGALIDPTFSHIYVSFPSDVKTLPLHGEGWTLDLNKGWSVVKGVREGDYTLKETK